MKRKNPNAVALGRLTAGKRRTLTAAQREAKRQVLAANRLKRWPKADDHAANAPLPSPARHDNVL